VTGRWPGKRPEKTLSDTPPQPARPRRAPLVLLVLGFVLLFGIVGAVAIFTFSAQRMSEEQHVLYRASVRIALLFSALQDIEASQRGYLVTHDAAYLEPYRKSVQALPERVDGVREAIATRPALQADFDLIKSIIPRKLDEIEHTIGLGQEGKWDEAVAIVRGDSGREMMDQIREAVGRMRTHQDEALEANAVAVAEAAARLRIGVGLVALLVLALGAYAFIIKRRQRLQIEESAGIIAEHSRALEAANESLRAEMVSRQAAEEQVRQMQRMEAIGQLAGGIAHDFNNMLAVVISAIGLAHRRLMKGDYDLGKYLDAAGDAANRAASLTKRLLAFSRQQALAPEPIDANKMVADMSELLRRTLGDHVQLETVLAGGLWRIKADVSQLENSVVNLAVNARDAMPKGGRITIETANAHLDDGYASQSTGISAGQYVLIAVTDTGTGMTPEVVARAFDPFFTTKKVGQGTGLGLSQVYGFVKQSGGHIKIYSEVGEGTVVKLYLPRYFGPDAVAAAQGEAGGKLVAAGERETVLVVEDEERVRALAIDALNEIGYTTIAVDCGRAALEVLEAHPEIVLLFTDIVMPDMNGRTLAELVLERRPAIKVLYTTGFTRNAVVHNGILDPGVNFIAKPFTLEQLAQKVREAIDG
jgi:signal transduction histidine kinase